MLGHFRQRVIHAVEAGVGRDLQSLGHFRACRFHAAGEVGGQGFEPGLGVRGGRFFHRVEAIVQGGEGLAQIAQGAGGLGLGLFQALAQAADHGLDDALAAVGFEAVDAGAHLGQGFAGAAFAVIEMGGDLAEGVFQRAQGFGGAGAVGLALDAAQAIGGAGLLGLDFLDGAFEAGGDGGLFAFGVFQAREDSAHRLVDAADGQGGALFGGLDALGQAVQRLGHAANLVGGMFGDLDARRRRPITARRLHIGGVARGGGEIVLRDGVLRSVVGQQTVNPLSQGEA